jgi:single-stranded DNA-binding protein
MTYYNNVILIGNVAALPCFGTTKTIGTHSYFPLAVERNPDLQENDTLEVDFHRITFLTNNEDDPVNLLKKGDKVIITGRLVNRRYSDEKSNTERFITEVQATSIEKLTNKL